ncbi:hypothetical protein C5167_016612 [Papaver somniferum]|uniref:indole-3-acetic acid-amido synthetase GH3.6-like n=1 Tax=Papaver somniferum TaxID=3469 RepID=UPI000E6F5AE7|nr:indole-3-acetic acid-amido synthetase GH3.6-like [Papaver somniferum]RZC93918.1 hypothetical protein C5167_016612 [Papaver somniferum]
MSSSPETKEMKKTSAASSIDYIDEKTKQVLQFIEEVTTKADEIQNQVLAEILSCNSQAEYLQRHGLNGCTDPDTFKKVVPVTSYENLKPDIDRLVANGNNSPVLCAQRISQFMLSSGTSSGAMKLIPSTEEQAERSWYLWSLIPPVVNQHIPGLNEGKAMQLFFVVAHITTPGGIVASPVSTSFNKSSKFKNLFTNIDPYRNYTSPLETIHCEDSHQSMYSQLLCGLYQNEQVLRLGCSFGTGFIQAIKFLQEHWRHFCDDIRNGTIEVDHAKITDPSVRNAVMRVLVKPNPELADFIEDECSRDESWKGIVSRLWPNAKCVDTVVSGTMSHHISTIEFYTNGLPIVSTLYACSECFLGINLNPPSKPREVCYTLIPTMAYFEFLPMFEEEDHRNQEREQRRQELVSLVDVKLGQEYELVITNYAGLYRYRVGDVLRVEGFKNNAPQFRFIRRNNEVLSIDLDKTNEVELQNAVTNAAEHLADKLNVSLVEYTSFADTSTHPGHYVIYWELQRSDSNASAILLVMEECCLIMEESLGAKYRQLRADKNIIGPLEIKIVETGTFQTLMDHARDNGSSIGQYKTPRSFKSGPVLKLLNSKVRSNYFSQQCPRP